MTSIAYATWHNYVFASIAMYSQIWLDPRLAAVVNPSEAAILCYMI